MTITRMLMHLKNILHKYLKINIILINFNKKKLYIYKLQYFNRYEKKILKYFVRQLSN